MHEVSLVRSLIRQVETLLADQGGGAVTEIHVSIGPLSGVEPLLVRSAFDQLAETSRAAGANLTIDCTQLEAICRACGMSFVVESFRFRCTACQSSSVRVTGGDEFRLLSVSIEDEQSPLSQNRSHVSDTTGMNGCREHFGGGGTEPFPPNSKVTTT